MENLNLEKYALVAKNLNLRSVRITGEAITTSPIRIGSGRDTVDVTSLAKVGILKLGEDPVIPGSSWKGAFRSVGEIVASKVGLSVCTGLTKETCMDKIETSFDNMIRGKRYGEALELVWKNTCINCKVFGSPSIESAVTFLDSVGKNCKLGVRTIIAIDRKTGSVRSSGLATVEVVESGCRFPFTLIGRNLPNYVLGYIISIMREFQEGRSQIGGYKSRGYGFISFENLRVDISPIEIGDKVRFRGIGEGDLEVILTKEEWEKARKGDFQVLSKFEEVFKKVKL
ncbi:CRISPR-associated RAMP protein Csx7 [Acidianus sp. RZ1]|uniref:type III CRISPR-associated RAMP protein Csx7 n=1 Tax=Acidianus sp. RZ1 TaxID=1540082 RepID=UPI0014913BCC|nr:CRISPR-associated RAMP protein Csx7 [Acidianus sp. RZ1]NON61604.1 CRISPR-associated RAMP protein [Acidianus sp. RZ1]